MYALVDGNCFYCSCERVFHAGLEGKPVVVLSNNDGCVISLSDEAKAAGIAMGAPIHLIRDMIRQHQVAVFSSNYTLYGDMSRRMMNLFTRFVPALEIYSIDEAFLDMSSLWDQDLLSLGMKIRSSVKQGIGIPTCVGIAPTKTLAKMANRYAKKNQKKIGVHWLANQELIDDALQQTLVEDVWGIGRQHAKRLHTAGFHTAYDFVQKAPADWVRTHMSVVGERLLNELKGIPSIEWDYEAPVQKNISCSRSFGSLQSDKKILQQALASHTAICAAKLREQHTCGSSLHISVETNRFRTQDKQYARSVVIDLERATSDTGELIQHALQGLDLIFNPGYRYQKCGIVVMGLVPETEVQATFFDTINRERSAALMKTMDAINRDLGKGTVHHAAQGDATAYALRANHKSLRFTTRWTELCKILH